MALSLREEGRESRVDEVAGVGGSRCGCSEHTVIRRRFHLERAVLTRGGAVNAGMFVAPEVGSAKR